MGPQEQAITDRYSEVRSRLWGKPKTNVVKLPPKPETPAPVRNWMFVHEDNVDILTNRADKIKQQVAKAHNISVEAMLSDRRYRELSWARQELYYRLRTECPHLSLSTIGRLAGGVDHTTVIHGIKQREKYGHRIFNPKDGDSRRKWEKRMAEYAKQAKRPYLNLRG
jgi:hypothetical protein